MSQVLDFRDVARPEKVWPRVVPRGDETDDFWPDVARPTPPDEEPPVDPLNAPKRVLFEALMVLSAVAILILAVTLFVPGR